MGVYRACAALGLVCRYGLVGLAAFCVSGLPGGFLQGYAWLQMAREAGGVAALPRVILEAAPCGICEAAMRVAEVEREGDREKGQGGARGELVLFRQVAEEEWLLWGGREDPGGGFGAAGREVGAGIGRAGPASPPPRGRVA